MKNSFIDYPNEVAAVVFTLGCNFNCWYCHNRSIIDENKYDKTFIDEKEILTFLQSRKDFIDGLVISGGEPTIYGNELKIFIKKVKGLGFKVKLDTNGTNPELVKELIDEKLIDFVAMDIKTTPEKYNKIIGRDLCFDNLKKTIDILIKSNIDYEFRTTFSPDVTVEDIENIGKMINGAKSYIIQKYNPVDNDVRKPHSLKDFNLAKEKVKDIVKCSLRI
ncbi:MAG: anaerobic ribonucleoside-triphosphate reductase activating protein [Clostridia bacterium]|nr:anaerobic ribonucleoside-triphosphate reductase activating protein [Clostridia bacterium]